MSEGFKRNVLEKIVEGIMAEVVNSDPENQAAKGQIDITNLKTAIRDEMSSVFSTEYTEYPNGMNDEYGEVARGVTASVQGSTASVGLPNDITYAREYRLSENSGRILYGFPEVIEHNIAEQILNGYYMLMNPKDGKTGGPLTYCIGRDMLMTATLNTLKDFKKLVVEEIFK